MHPRVENFQPKPHRGQVSLHWWKVYIVSGNGLMPPGRRSFAAPIFPDSRVHGANMWPIWGRKDPGGPHVGPMNLAIWVGQYLTMASLHQNELTTLKKGVNNVIGICFTEKRSPHIQMTWCMPCWVCSHFCGVIGSVFQRHWRTQVKITPLYEQESLMLFMRKMNKK